MKSWFSIAVLLFGLAVLTGCGSEGGHAGQTNETQEPPADRTGLELVDGFRASIVADEIGAARHLAVRDNGDIYVMLSKMNKDGGIAALRDADGDGQAEVVEYFGDYIGTGIEIRGDYLYFSSDTSIHRYPLAEGELVPTGEAEQIVGGLPLERQHAAKPFTFDGAGNLYVTVGAPSNACQVDDRQKGSPGQDPCPLLERYGGIWRFEAERPGQTQEADGYRYVTGIRHVVALQWNDAENALYAVQHGRDQLHFLFPDLYTEQESAELPAEEFLRMEDGDNFGWPYCYYDQKQGKKVLAPEYGGDGDEVGRCGDMKEPLLGFPGHYAPNDLLFYTGDNFPEAYRNGAFIAFHGSWNRAPLEQEGYNVVFVPMADGKPSGEWRVFAGNFAGVDPVESPRDAYHRPCGLAVGPDGALYVADSTGGRIYRIQYGG